MPPARHLRTDEHTSDIQPPPEQRRLTRPELHSAGPRLDSTGQHFTSAPIHARTSPRRRRPSVLASCATVFVGMAFGLGTGVGCSVYGTDSAARAAIEHDVAEFRAEAGAVVPKQAELHTDFEAEPPPQSDLTASPWGLLIVPSWAGAEGVYGERLDEAIPLKQGIVSQVLDSGSAGHFIETAGPGDVGNFAVAAHRRSYGSNFSRLPELALGDQIIVETSSAWYVYEVMGAQIVLPNDVGVLAPVPNHPGAQPTERLMTLVTCHSITAGAWGNDHRWVTSARLVGWLERDAGMPASLAGATV